MVGSSSGQAERAILGKDGGGASIEPAPRQASARTSKLVSVSTPSAVVTMSNRGQGRPRLDNGEPHGRLVPHRAGQDLSILICGEGEIAAAALAGLGISPEVNP